MKLNDHTEVKLLSMAFTYHLIKELEIGAIDEINRLNATEEYKGCCASHDFCDSNMTMESALTTCGYTTTLEFDADIHSLINRAWDRAKKLKFNPECVDGCTCHGPCECLPIPSDHKVFGVSA
tara:strand:- start:190 stop:558 length:369 start_codon:yes stop_codon:yes gene_type:complete